MDPVLRFALTLDCGDWTKDAACLEHVEHADHWWFSEAHQPGAVAQARRICDSCLVRTECLEYALRSGEKFGMWGGKSERERRQMRDARAAA